MQLIHYKFNQHCFCQSTLKTIHCFEVNYPIGGFLYKMEFKKTKAEKAIEEKLRQLEEEQIEVVPVKEKKSKNEKNAKETEGSKAVNFIKVLIEKMNVNCSVDLTEDDEKIDILIKGQNTGMLIGYRGDVLDSIQYLVSSLINNEREDYKRVTVDCENYREKRELILAGLARRLADKAVRTGRKVNIEPMNPAERRIIHSTLQENLEVTTSSEGIDPNRYVVITPKLLKDTGFKTRNYNDSRNYNNNRNRNEKGGFNADRKREEKSRPAFKTGFGSFLGNTKKD